MDNILVVKGTTLADEKNLLYQAFRTLVQYP